MYILKVLSRSVNNKVRKTDKLVFRCLYIISKCSVSVFNSLSGCTENSSIVVNGFLIFKLSGTVSFDTGSVQKDTGLEIV